MDIVDVYGLSLLREEPGDWAIEDGNLARTNDGDIRNGSIRFSALSRLVTLWSHNETHLKYLFEAADEMIRTHGGLGDELDRIDSEHRSGFDAAERFTGDAWERFAEAVRTHTENEGVVFFGANTYAGSLLIALSNAVQRFKKDIGGSPIWDTAGPTFGNCSVGRILIAAGNGYRHEEEWAAQLASAGKLMPQQSASFNIIEQALVGYPKSEISGPARVPEILQLLGNGDFDRLARHIFEFAHTVARAAPSSP